MAIAQVWPDWTVRIVAYLASVGAYEAENVLLETLADLLEEIEEGVASNEIASALAQLCDLLASALARKAASVLGARHRPAA